LKLSKVITLLFSLIVYQLVGQPPKFSPPIGEEDYYMFPIRPNQPNTLAGNMGELRTSHFHAGLDIRTGGRKGLPVYAAADGYISRISISEGGYGKALYISHPNGEITVYAHLEKFTEDITKYTQNQQYAEKSLHVKLFPNKNDLIFKKGDIIAYSGNSGSSGGPHLHFEIRDKNHVILNPLKYNFEEIKDSTSPIVKKLAILPFTIDSRVNGIFQRKEIEIEQKSKVRYNAPDTIEVFGKIGFELLTYDKLDGVNFKCGISEIDFYIGNDLVFNQKIDSLKFSTQRNILVHYNYERYIETGNKFHKMYIDNGNMLDIYNTNEHKGKFIFDESCIYNALVKISDVYGNESIFEFVLKCTSPTFNTTQQIDTQKISQLNNVLVIQNNNKDSTIQILSPHNNHSISPKYVNNNNFTYLWKMNNSSIQSIDLCDSLIVMNPQEQVPPNTVFDFYDDKIKTHFRKNSLFDTIYYSTDNYYNADSTMEIFSIGNPKLYPLRNSIDLTILSNKNFDVNKTHAYKISENKYSFSGGVWKEHQFHFSTREFGEYTLLTDSIAPSITPITLSKSNLKFKIKDDLSGIKNFNVLVNEKWILMDYDYKTNQIWSVDFNSSNNEQGIIKVIVTDNADNETIYTSIIK